MKITSRISRGVLALCLLLCIAMIPIAAQTAGTGGLTGTITDATGAAIPNVTVTLTSAGTGQARVATSDAGGAYRFALLPPGAYRISFSANGFKISEIASIQIVVTETPVLDRSLEIGSRADKITVESSVETIQTTVPLWGPRSVPRR